MSTGDRCFVHFPLSALACVGGDGKSRDVEGRLLGSWMIAGLALTLAMVSHHARPGTAPRYNGVILFAWRGWVADGSSDKDGLACCPPRDFRFPMLLRTRDTGIMDGPRGVLQVSGAACSPRRIQSRAGHDFQLLNAVMMTRRSHSPNGRASRGDRPAFARSANRQHCPRKRLGIVKIQCPRWSSFAVGELLFTDNAAMRGFLLDANADRNVYRQIETRWDPWGVWTRATPRLRMRIVCEQRHRCSSAGSAPAQSLQHDLKSVAGSAVPMWVCRVPLVNALSPSLCWI